MRWQKEREAGKPSDGQSDNLKFIRLVKNAIYSRKDK